MATTARDAQTLLSKFREKYPQYNKVDDGLLLSKIQEKYPQYADIKMNTRPSSGALLDRAVKPFMSASDIPQIAFQGAQGAVGNAPQNIIENPLITSIGGPSSAQMKSGMNVVGGISKLFGNKNASQPETTAFSEKYLEPKTVGGKMLGIGANILGGMVPIGVGATKAIPKLAEAVDLAKAERGLSDAVYAGGKDVAKRIQNLFKMAKNDYQAVVDTADASQMTMQDLVDVLDETIKNKNINEMLIKRPAEKELLNVRGHYANKIKEAEQAVPAVFEDTVDPIMNTVSRKMVSPGTQGAEAVNPQLSHIAEIKNFKNQVYKSLYGESDLEGEFLKNFGLKLESKGLGDITEAGKAYRNAYSMLDKSKALRRPTLMRIAKGKVGPIEMSDIANVQKEIGGIDVIGKAQKAGKNVSNVKRNRVIAGGLTTLGTAGGGIALLKKLFSQKD